MKRLWKLLGQLLVISVLLNLVIETVSRKSLFQMCSYLIGNPGAFGLNVLLILVPFLIVFFTRRKIFFVIVLVVFWLTLGVINGVLLVFRTTPFTASDFRLVKYAFSLLTTYLSWWQIVLAVVALAAACMVCFMVWKLASVDENPIQWKPVGVVVAVTVAGIWLMFKAAILTGVVAVHFGNIGQAFQAYGFAYGFSCSMFQTGIPKPEEYNAEVVTEIEQESLAAVELDSEQKQRMPNIIMVQLESFFDPTLWEGNQTEADPIPYFRFLTRQYPSGYLNVPSVGAGTANTEFECITGMNLDFFGPGEYPYKTVLQKTVCESLPFDLKALGYKSHAIHNNEGTFYDRHKVFSQLGFDTFTPIEYMYHIERNPTLWCKDKILVEEVEKALDTTLGADFVYTISVQGHGKYPSFEYYCEQIHEMDAFINELVIRLNKRNEPTVLVLYGDHLPSFEWTEEEMKNGTLFQTQYVIWNNLGIGREPRDLESYQLGAYVLELLGIHEGTMVRFHQQYLNEEQAGAEAADEREESYLNAMEILEYDILYGDRAVYGGEMPFEASDMVMGTTPIIQKTTLHVDDQIIVFGENFNEYSQICVNGKAVATPYIHEQRLIAKGVPYKDGEIITVEQIGRDKVPLGIAKKGPGS